MNIGQAAKVSGVSSKMIRHYEGLGLIRPANRTASNYRDFEERDVEALRFIRRARTFGFSLTETDRLLKLWRDRGRLSREVKAIALKHVEGLDSRIVEMQVMADQLRQLAEECAGDEQPNCPILNNLTSVAGS